MTLSYAIDGGPVNPSAQFSDASAACARLCAGAESFHRWIWKWHQQTGQVFASTGYFAKKQGVTERTIYHWLRALLDAGRIHTDVDAGIERRIVPLVPPLPNIKAPKRRSSKAICDLRLPICDCDPEGATAEPAQGQEQPPPKKLEIGNGKSAIDSGVISGVCFRGPIQPTTHHTQDTTTPTAPPQPAIGNRKPEIENPSPVVAVLLQEGIAETVAEALVQSAGEQAVQEQIEALPHRRCRDKAAVLVASIRDRYPLPAVLLKQRERKQQEQHKEAERAFAAALARKRDEEREAALQHLQGLPEGEKRALQERAEAEAMQALPRPLAQKAKMSNSPVWQASVKAALLRLAGKN